MLAPVRWMHDDWLVYRLSPAGRCAAAGKYERVRPLSVKNDKFWIAVKRCSLYALPLGYEHQSI